MASRLITNIKSLVNVREDNKLLRGKELAELPCIENAYLIIEEGVIATYGEMKAIGSLQSTISSQIDVTGQFILPAWCDSHTHLVFAITGSISFSIKSI